MRQYEVLSITTAPAFAARGANDRRHLAAGRRQDDVDALEIECVERLHLEDIVLAERHLLADRGRGGQRDDFVGREIALGEGGQHLASDIAGRADHRYPETHLALPRRLGADREAAC